MYQNEKTIIKFGDTKIEKHKFYQYKKLISIKTVDINKIVVSNKVSLVKRVLNISLTAKMLKS